MTLRKRHKASRYRGTRSHGRGHKNRTRGSGNRGGVGLSGTGKRGDQKKTYVIKHFGGDYFGKDQVRRKARRIPLKIITLKTVIENISTMVKNGIAKPLSGGFEIILDGYKLIGTETVPFKLKISVRAVTSGARNSVDKAGGTVQILRAKEAN